jgi:hypothetical protein
MPRAVTLRAGIYNLGEAGYPSHIVASSQLLDTIHKYLLRAEYVSDLLARLASGASANESGRGCDAGNREELRREQLGGQSLVQGFAGRSPGSARHSPESRTVA